MCDNFLFFFRENSFSIDSVRFIDAETKLSHCLDVLSSHAFNCGDGMCARKTWSKQQNKNIRKWWAHAMRQALVIIAVFFRCFYLFWVLCVTFLYFVPKVRCGLWLFRGIFAGLSSIVLCCCVWRPVLSTRVVRTLARANHVYPSPKMIYGFLSLSRIAFYCFHFSAETVRSQCCLHSIRCATVSVWARLNLVDIPCVYYDSTSESKYLSSADRTTTNEGYDA